MHLCFLFEVYYERYGLKVVEKRVVWESFCVERKELVSMRLVGG